MYVFNVFLLKRLVATRKEVFNQKKFWKNQNDYVKSCIRSKRFREFEGVCQRIKGISQKMNMSYLLICIQRIVINSSLWYIQWSCFWYLKFTLYKIISLFVFMVYLVVVSWQCFFSFVTFFLYCLFSLKFFWNNLRILFYF